MTSTPQPARPYASTLRERQVAQTRELILDAVTDLLGERRVDEVTTREIAAKAGVSERTVYRHFPDRGELLEGLTQRLGTLNDGQPHKFGPIGELPELCVSLMAGLDNHYAVARAEAIFNADPRQFSVDTRSNSHDLVESVRRGFPDLSERDHVRIAAVLRCLLSTQAWLRMREEFGVPGTESGPVVAWVIETIIRELGAGGRPGDGVTSGARHQM